MTEISIFINDREYKVDKSLSILEACQVHGFDIPTLCHLKGITTPGACRVCLVEVEGARNLQASCSTPIREGMKIHTNTERVIESRRINMELLMVGHEDCLSCWKNGSCELQKVAEESNIKEWPFKSEKKYKIDDSAPAYERDNNLCILCERCVNICEKTVGVATLNYIHRGKKAFIGNAFDKPIMDSECIECGQCVLHCPTGALREKSEIDAILHHINNPEKLVVVQTAPAVRTALGEPFGIPVGTLVTGKMVASLKRIGFDKILDTTFGADQTIMEEGYELLRRLENPDKYKVPQFTSCCPAWVKFVEHFYPDLIPYLSTSKSPHQMLGATIKVFYSKKFNVDPNNIVNVSVMPCTAKKYEKQRQEIDSVQGYSDVDYILTTRELAKMIEESSIDFVNLPDEEFDPLGIGSGAGDMFGVTGGVMEAALRTAYEVKTGTLLENIEFDQIRGLKGVKEGKIELMGTEVWFAVVSGLENVKPFIEEVLRGESKYHFIEVMTCPGGCIGGGGQPIPTNAEILDKRMHAIYHSDRSKTIRRSYENPAIKAVYSEFFGEPLSEKAEKYLHTSYVRRGKYHL